MIKNYILIAFRTLVKNRAYAALNILGLSFGLSIFLFSQIIADYERGYDRFFKGSENIYAPYITLTPGGPLGDMLAPTIPTAAKVVLDNIPGIEAMSWSISRDHVVEYEEAKFYEQIRFLDHAFYDIFEIDFLQGSVDAATRTANSISISENMAEKYFADKNPIGETLTLDGEHSFTVAAVFYDLPKNSHFVNSIAGFEGFNFLGTMDGFRQLDDFDLAGQWGGLSSSEITYVKLAEGVDMAALHARLDDKFVELVPERMLTVFSGIRFRALDRMNLFVWDTMGIPAISIMEMIGLLVLLVVVFNYTILGYAQALGRTREVGIRKSLGAARKNIFIQFITESTLLCAAAGFFAVIIIELTLPILNEAIDRNIEFDFIRQPFYALFLITTVLVTGFATGLYPALFLSRLRVAKILSGATTIGSKSNWLKNTLLVAQFTVSAVLITAAGIISIQNMKLDQAADRFDRENIINIQQFREEMHGDYNALRLELMNISGVRNVAGALQAPFEQNQSIRSLGTTSVEEDAVMMLEFSVEESYLDLYSVDIVAGRGLSRARGDAFSYNSDDTDVTVPIVLNEFAVKAHGYASNEEAVGQALRSPGSSNGYQFVVVGVAEDRKFLDIFSEPKPMMFNINPDSFSLVSIELEPGWYAEAVSAITDVWSGVYPAYPIVIRSLNEQFEENFSMLRSVSVAIIALSIVTVFFALIGLFGLSAYIVERRRKEIAIRKVMGAQNGSIIGMLLWQFSKPMILALLFGLPLSIFAGGKYLEIFSERAEFGVGFYMMPIAFILMITWSVVSVHAFKVARANPILALRSE